MPGSLKLDVFNTGYRPIPSASPVWPDGWQATWPATTASLVSGDRDAVLVDALLTKAESRELADWLAAAGKHLTEVYITHAHADHFFGPGTASTTPTATPVPAAGCRWSSSCTSAGTSTTGILFHPVRRQPAGRPAGPAPHVCADRGPWRSHHLGDPMILPRYCHLLAGLIPGAQVKIYPDSAHGFLFQHHQEFAADVSAFLGDAG